jgi:hypothetical protein
MGRVDWNPVQRVQRPTQNIKGTQKLFILVCRSRRIAECTDRHLHGANSCDEVSNRKTEWNTHDFDWLCRSQIDTYRYALGPPDGAVLMATQKCVESANYTSWISFKVPQQIMEETLIEDKELQQAQGCEA